MAKGLREFFNTPAGKGMAAAVALIGLAGAVWTLRGGGNDPYSTPVTRMVINARGEAYEHTIPLGQNPPWKGRSGEEVWLAHPCYFTATGQLKDEPKWVMLERDRDPQNPQPTFCGECGFLVLPGARRPEPEPDGGVRRPLHRSVYQRAAPDQQVQMVLAEEAARGR